MVALADGFAGGDGQREQPALDARTWLLQPALEFSERCFERFAVTGVVELLGRGPPRGVLGEGFVGRLVVDVAQRQLVSERPDPGSRGGCQPLGAVVARWGHGPERVRRRLAP